MILRTLSHHLCLKKTFAFLNFRWRKRLKSSVFILAFWAFLDLDLQKHTAKTLFTTKEQGSYSKRMQPSFSFVLHYDTSFSWIFRKTEQYGKEIMYLAVMFLTLNNQYQKHIIPKRLTNCDKVLRFGVICVCQYYIQSSQPKRPKESLSLFS